MTQTQAIKSLDWIQVT